MRAIADITNYVLWVAAGVLLGAAVGYVRNATLALALWAEITVRARHRASRETGRALARIASIVCWEELHYVQFGAVAGGVVWLGLRASVLSPLLALAVPVVMAVSAVQAWAYLRDRHGWGRVLSIVQRDRDDETAARPPG